MDNDGNRARKRTLTQNRPKDQLGRMDLSRDIVMTRTVF
jgi:hypothetical protein